MSRRRMQRRLPSSSNDRRKQLNERATTAPTAPTARKTYTVMEAAAILGISRSTAYECVRTGQIQALRLRRRIVIPESAITELLSSS